MRLFFKVKKGELRGRMVKRNLENLFGDNIKNPQTIKSHQKRKINVTEDSEDDDDPPFMAPFEVDNLKRKVIQLEKENTVLIESNRKLKSKNEKLLKFNFNLQELMLQKNDPLQIATPEIPQPVKSTLQPVTEKQTGNESSNSPTRVQQCPTIQSPSTSSVPEYDQKVCFYIGFHSYLHVSEHEN